MDLVMGKLGCAWVGAWVVHGMMHGVVLVLWCHVGYTTYLRVENGINAFISKNLIVKHIFVGVFRCTYA